MIKSNNNSKDTTEKVMIILGVAIIIVAFFLGHRIYALGVGLSSLVAWILYRWQMIAVLNQEGISPRKATARLLTRSIIRMMILFSLLGLSILGGEAFLFGVLTGLLLQVITYMSRAFFIILRKGGTA